ncbi:hypothetical protein [Streptomyces roseolilacinus]|uniref:Uncharacterized protein n=1 Tax=Streptomyces roseolilacinus TaxID=66904 RepID=A0A918B296_9ACTN|nr:hypothetical protein [Streptomyces roseolilacinus]GGQ18296.1 hypothetical protein GCM10010249_41110 [Streptomyces roseolilacinus]
MHAPLSSLVAATAQWLVRAYPAGGGAVDRALAEAQARQAAGVAAALRYPTELDAALVAVTGAGGADRLDWVTGAEGDDAPWRSWVDEVVASWAACLLGEPALASAAVAATAGRAPAGYHRLLSPGDRDRRAAALLRHPDLLAPVADLHRAALLAALALDPRDPALPV